MSNTTIQIKARYATLSEAFDAAVARGVLDISYNPQEARRSVKATEFSGPDGWSSKEAYLTEGGDIYYVYQCDIRLLNKFSPFHSCLDNSDLRFATISENEISITTLGIRKTPGNRRRIAKLQQDSPNLLVA